MRLKRDRLLKTVRRLTGVNPGTESQRENESNANTVQNGESEDPAMDVDNDDSVVEEAMDQSDDFLSSQDHINQSGNTNSGQFNNRQLAGNNLDRTIPPTDNSPLRNRRESSLPSALFGISPNTPTLNRNSRDALLSPGDAKLLETLKAKNINSQTTNVSVVPERNLEQGVNNPPIIPHGTTNSEHNHEVAPTSSFKEYQAQCADNTTWEELLDDYPVLAIMMSGKRDSPQSSLHLQEIDIQIIFDEYIEQEFVLPFTADRCAQIVKGKLMTYEHYLRDLRESMRRFQKKHDPEIREVKKEEQARSKRLDTHRNAPTVQKISLVPDLWKFEQWCINHGVLDEDFIPLLITKVPEDRSATLRQALLDGVFKENWVDNRQTILRIVWPEKSLNEYEEELRALRPRVKETQQEYNNRFLAYVKYLQMDPQVAATIFIKSLPKEFLDEVDRYKITKEDSDGCIEVEPLMQYLYKFYSRRSPNYCYVIYTKDKTKNENRFNRPRGIGKGEKLKRYLQKQAEERNRQLASVAVDLEAEPEIAGQVAAVLQTRCWKCNRAGHRQPECRAKEGPLVKKNMYKPDSTKNCKHWSWKRSKGKEPSQATIATGKG